MKEIIHNMLSGKMTIRKLILWLAIAPLVGVSWIVLLIAIKALRIVSYFYDNLPSLLPLIFK